jgi:hypothetical protein
MLIAIFINVLSGYIKNYKKQISRSKNSWDQIWNLIFVFLYYICNQLLIIVTGYYEILFSFLKTGLEWALLANTTALNTLNSAAEIKNFFMAILLKLTNR